MTKLTLTLAALLISGSALACGGKSTATTDHHQPCAEGMCPHKTKQPLSQRLGLDGDKADQVDTIEQEFYEQKQALKAEKHSRLAEILSEEEMAQLKAMKHKKCDKKKAHGKRCDGKKKNNPLTE